MENGGYSQLITLHFCCLFLLTLFPTPVWDLFHRIQSFPKCSMWVFLITCSSSGTPLSWIQPVGYSTSGTVFQPESPMGHRPSVCSSAWVSPPARSLLQCGLCMGRSFLQDTSLWMQGHNPLHYGLVTGSRETSALVAEHFLPLLTWPWCCRTVPLPFNSLLSHTAAQCFSPFFAYVSHWCYQWWAQLWPAVGPFRAGWNSLCPIWGQPLVSSHRIQPCNHSDTKISPHKSNMVSRCR